METNCQQVRLALNSPQSLRARRSFEAEIVPLLSHCDEARTVIPHFYKCFMLVMASQKIYIKEKKSGWYVEVAFFQI